MLSPAQTPRVYRLPGSPLLGSEVEGPGPQQPHGTRGLLPSAADGGGATLAGTGHRRRLAVETAQLPWSVQKSSVLVEMEDLQDPAGRFGQDDMGNKDVVWKSGPHEFRSHCSMTLGHEPVSISLVGLVETWAAKPLVGRHRVLPFLKVEG